MKSRASLFLLLLVSATSTAAQEPAVSNVPRGSSEVQAGEIRYDVVGFAATGDLAGVSAASADLAVGTYAEITALDSGRTIVVAIRDGVVATGRLVTVSPGAATALGMTGDRLAVRVRKVVPTPQDIVQLRGGQAASFRADAPAALLVALRKKAPAVAAVAAVSPIKPAKVVKTRAAAIAPSLDVPAQPPKAGVARPVATSGYVVQVAALSSASRAAQVARSVGGVVAPGPPVWRVRLGPYPDTTTATRAKADAARKGYPGGQITRIP